MFANHVSVLDSVIYSEKGMFTGKGRIDEGRVPMRKAKRQK